MAADWVEVFTTHDQMEAELVKGLLEGSAIPVVVEARGLKALSYFFGTAAMGQVVLKVPPDLAATAEALLAARVEEDPSQ